MNMNEINTNYKLNIYKNDIIWYKKPEVLFYVSRLSEFFPTIKMTYEEKMNSLVRFTLYLSILLMIVKKNYLYIYIFILGLISTYLLSNNTYLKQNYLNIMEKLSNNNNSNDYNDSNDSKNSNKKNNFKNIINNNCSKPTKNNPFMNILMSDYKYNTHKIACPITEDIKTEIKKNFNHNLYKDLSDIYENSNSQRQYYTNPSTTIPNDQSSFANWLYKVPSTCKAGNGNDCSKLQSPNYQLSNQLYKYI